MAITVEQVIAITQRHREVLQRMRPPGANPFDEQRWAYLVTLPELNELIDEMKSMPEYIKSLPPEIEVGLREGRGALHLNGVAILPELMIQENSGGLNG